MIKPDEIIRSKRKTIALIIERDGRLIVRAPLHARQEMITGFIQSKEKWISKKRAEIKTNYQPFITKKYHNGEGFWYLGKTYPLQIVEVEKPILDLDGSFQLARKAVPKASLVFEQWYRQQARRVISERVLWYAKKTGFSYRQIRITSAQMRWGSCGARGTLNFSWRLVMAPLTVIDYVVVHELVHLKVRNHSQEFWTQVRWIMPDYRKQVDWLEKNGHLLRLR